jgi:hypothetical protein
VAHGVVEVGHVYILAVPVALLWRTSAAGGFVFPEIVMNRAKE